MPKELKSLYFKPLSEEQIIEQVQRVKNPGQWRSVKWLHDIVDIGTKGDEVAIVYTKSCRIGINYDNMKSVKERKEKEDAEIGAPKDRRESSYVHLKDEKGELVEPNFIVHSRLHPERKYLQVMKSGQKTTLTRGIVTEKETKVSYYKNGIKIDPEKNKTLMSLIMAKTKDKKVSGPTDTWVLPYKKILEII